MTAIHRAYLFDTDNYRSTIWPILESMEKDNFNALRAKAEQVSVGNPEVWRMLEDHRFYQNDLGHEEEEFDTVEGRVKFWMMIVLSQYWKVLDTSPSYAVNIAEAMRYAGEDEEVITKLTVGKTFYALLRPQNVKNPVMQRVNEKWPSWSRMGMCGWLDTFDVGELQERIVALEESFRKVTNGQDDRSLKWFSAYRTAIIMLSTAQQTKQGLFLAILD